MPTTLPSLCRGPRDAPRIPRSRAGSQAGGTGPADPRLAAVAASHNIRRRSGAGTGAGAAAAGGAAAAAAAAAASDGKNKPKPAAKRPWLVPVIVGSVILVALALGLGLGLGELHFQANSSQRNAVSSSRTCGNYMPVCSAPLWATVHTEQTMPACTHLPPIQPIQFPHLCICATSLRPSYRQLFCQTPHGTVLCTPHPHHPGFFSCQPCGHCCLQPHASKPPPCLRLSLCSGLLWLEGSPHPAPHTTQREGAECCPECSSAACVAQVCAVVVHLPTLQCPATSMARMLTATPPPLLRPGALAAAGAWAWRPRTRPSCPRSSKCRSRCATRGASQPAAPATRSLAMPRWAPRLDRGRTTGERGRGLVAPVAAFVVWARHRDAA